MSVTFQIESLPTGKFTFDCYGKGYSERETFGPFDSYDEALLAVTAHKMQCTECDCYGCYANAIMDVDDELNLSNTNAVMVLDILGIETDFEHGIVGSMKAEDFLGHVMVAMAQERDNAAVPATVDAQQGRATFVDCGLPEGYVAERLVILADMATEAMRIGRDITWA